jgi:hypothetical protein
MMKKVVCINNKNLPSGAVLQEGQEYKVEREYLNNFDQQVYILYGIINEGTTPMGLRWIGYDSARFTDPETAQQVLEEQKYEYA